MTQTSTMWNVELVVLTTHYFLSCPVSSIRLDARTKSNGQSSRAPARCCLGL